MKRGEVMVQVHVCPRIIDALIGEQWLDLASSNDRAAISRAIEDAMMFIAEIGGKAQRIMP